MSEHIHLTDLEQLLLLSVLRLPDGAWGGAIQDDLATSASRRVSLGSIHVTLGRLEERGLVRSAKGQPSGLRGGKARRLYEVLPEGRAALEWTREMMRRLWAGVPAEGRG